MCIYETLPKLVTFHRQKKKKMNKQKQAKTLENAWLIILALPVYLSIQVIILFCEFSDSLFFDCLFVLFFFFFLIFHQGKWAFRSLALKKNVGLHGHFLG